MGTSHTAPPGGTPPQIIGHLCEYNNGKPLENFATYAGLILTIEPDADGALCEFYYADYRKISDVLGSRATLVDAVGIGDQAFSVGDTMSARWGRWCVTVVIVDNRMLGEDKLPRLRDIMLLVLTRFPRDD